MENAQKIAGLYADIHQSICQTLEKADGQGTFGQFPWSKAIGSGLTCVLTNGAAIEKAGANFSNVTGVVTPQMEKIIGEKAGSYKATGISSIIHPINPFLPIMHMNVRYFELDNGTAWFGGGIDLTPHYVDTTEARQFHETLETLCNQYNKTYYARFKKWADDYFYLPHRQETRGVGGIFFDRIQPAKDDTFEHLTAFTCDLAKTYPLIYSDRIAQKATLPYGENEKLWQKIRRGRYVEFNLLYDRGTKFGMESGGNIESILVSLPPEVTWEYNVQPAKGSAEESTLQMLKKDIDWLHGKLSSNHQ